MKKKRYLVLEKEDGSYIYLEVRVDEKTTEECKEIGITFTEVLTYYNPPFYLGFYFTYLIFLLQDIINFKFFNHKKRLQLTYHTMSEIHGIELTEKQKIRQKELNNNESS